MSQDRRFTVQGGGEERSLGELFGELARDTSNLVRQEVRLASAEITQKAKSAGRYGGLVGAGGALLHAGLLALVAAAVIGLAAVVPAWLSALIVGLVLAGVGYALVRSGLGGLGRIDPTPQQTVETLKEDAAWMKDQVK